MDVFTVEFISSVGFPIAMCFYLITRFEKTLTENTMALQSLKDVIARVVK
jgi:hypothetical protein